MRAQVLGLTNGKPGLDAERERFFGNGEHMAVRISDDDGGPVQVATARQSTRVRVVDGMATSCSRKMP